MPIGFDDNTVILLPGLVSNGFDDSTLMKVDLNGSIFSFSTYNREFPIKKFTNIIHRHGPYITQNQNPHRIYPLYPMPFSFHQFR